MRETMQGLILGAAILAVLAVPSEGEPQVAARPARHGLVHGSQHAFADDGGAFVARGATLFWGLWGYQHDRERLGRNLATLRSWGTDYVRVLGVVGVPGDQPGDSWRDRRADPSGATYAKDVAGFTDWVYGRYGIRVQWTIFGGVDFTPTPQARRALVERFGEMSHGREEKIFAFEVANEAWQNGFPGEQGRLELHTLAQALKSHSRNLVALSAPEGSSCGAAQALYGGSVADLVTLHLARGEMSGGAIWRTFREPWLFHDCQGLPALASSNEPVGPESSVASLDDPAALAGLAAVTYGSGIGAFVLHTGPGIRGGGAADRERARHGNVWELPTGSRIGAALSALTRVLPGDFANWEKHDVLGEPAAGALFGVSEREALAGLYCFSKAPAFVCVALGITRPFQLVARRPLAASLRHPATGSSTAVRRLQGGAPLPIPASSAVRLIVGRLE